MRSFCTAKWAKSIRLSHITTPDQVCAHIYFNLPVTRGLLDWLAEDGQSSYLTVITLGLLHIYTICYDMSCLLYLVRVHHRRGGRLHSCIDTPRRSLRGDRPNT